MAGASWMSSAFFFFLAAQCRTVQASPPNFSYPVISDIDFTKEKLCVMFRVASNCFEQFYLSNRISVLCISCTENVLEASSLVVLRQTQSKGPQGSSEINLTTLFPPKALPAMQCIMLSNETRPVQCLSRRMGISQAPREILFPNPVPFTLHRKSFGSISLPFLPSPWP